MCTKLKTLSVILTVLILLLTAIPAQSATEAEKQAAIDAGLAWLATQQNGDGSWTYDGTPETDVAATGAALLAFIEEGHTPTSGAYSTNVANGMNYLFTNAQIVDPITVQPAGDPDTNGNGIGLKFVLGGPNGRDIYTTGLALLPIAAVGTGTVSVAGSQVDGWSYAQVIQDTVDYFAFGQCEPLPWRGGWRYTANEGTSDNSTSQWPTIGLLYAQSAGATVPGWVATELAFWTVYIQNADGGSDYDTKEGWESNVSRTGTLLSEQVFSGAGGGTAAALNYLNNQWLTTANSDWNGNFGHPYAMWAAYKGLELTIGLDDETTITNLHADPGDVDNPDHGWNWWEDYCEYLVNTQVGGTWPGYMYWTGPIATGWYINILAATEIPPPEIPVALDVKPTSCPNPFNVGSKGVLPIAICGTEDFDVTQVDISTVLLMLVEPLRWANEDVCTAYYPLAGKASQYDCTEEGPDGYMDLTLKFDCQVIAEALETIGGPLTDGEEILVTLTGNLLPEYGGTRIEGEDVVRIIKKD